ncbi:DUF6318 family protein [Janibacter terrae]|uniref:DUF6318 family protein n=1 Tax=Janibacter terrae TaxID=103817 RepID=UPI0038141A87
MQFSRGAAAMAATAVLTGGLAACGEDEPTEPTTTASPIEVDPSSSTSSGPSVSPSSTGAGAEMPKDMPAAARKETKAGAAAFGKYYQSAFGDAAASGDTDIIESLRAAECNACIAGEKQIKDDKKKGWVRSANPYSLSEVEATKRPDSGYKVSMAVKAKKHYRVDEAGKANAVVKPVQFTLSQHVTWVDGRWTMQSWIASAS